MRSGGVRNCLALGHNWINGYRSTAVVSSLEKLPKFVVAMERLFLDFIKKKEKSIL